MLQLLSPSPVPDALRERLRTLPFYKGGSTLANDETFEVSKAVDSHEFLHHLGQFRFDSVAVILTFLSGGTILKPKLIPYTLNDYRASVRATAAALDMTEAVRARRACLLHPYAPWAIGGIFQQALVDLRCDVLPLGLGLQPDRIGEILRSFRPQVLVGPCSLLLKVLRGFDAAGFCRTIVNAGEPLLPEIRQEFRRMGAQAFDVYGMAEFDTLGGECREHRLHLLHDDFVFELLPDREAEAREPGTRGELFVTPLRREAFGVYRYRTGDCVEVESIPCACGRPGPTLRGIGRREALYIDGVCVTAAELQRAIDSAGVPLREYQLRAAREGDGTVCVHLDFTADRRVSARGLESLRECLTRMNIDWEDLIRCQSCRVEAPCQVSSLDSRRTPRGKLARIAWG